jgi:phosphopantothenoylcysteine decarboxylase/phosphopantothenate--cysteine ligase
MGVNIIKVITAKQMYQACVENNTYDIAIMAAAVADYTPVEVFDQKIKKTDDELIISLKKTDDILATLGKTKNNGQLLVGFALETENEKENALKKLHNKNADLIILNSLRDEGAGFESDTNKITLLYKNGQEKSFEAKSKSMVAKDIIDAIIELL